jgi:hypothetical protein
MLSSRNDEIDGCASAPVICTIVAKTGDRQNGKDAADFDAQLSITNGLLLLRDSHDMGKSEL